LPAPLFTEAPWLPTWSALNAWSEIIDVRSPGEFAQDHLPGAINLPVLDDTERAAVGTLYRQVSPFQARKLGAAMVSANIARHLREHFAEQPKTYHPLIYCWRGGQRSGSLALVLGQVGWRVTLLTGGYKTYRWWVQAQLQELPAQFNFRLLTGMTGCGKTLMLQALAAQGQQVLDLEALARHRGSLLGQMPAPAPASQPSQKAFDSDLLRQLGQLDPHQPIWTEAESSKIGQVYLPVALYQRLSQAATVEVTLPLPERVAYLCQDYTAWTQQPALLKQRLGMLKSRYGQTKLAQWYASIDAADWPGLVGDLLETHYDPAYRHASQHHQRGSHPATLPPITLPHLSPMALAAAAQALISGSRVGIT
jgi:tRNA 2-selenouridine synthase